MTVIGSFTLRNYFSPPEGGCHILATSNVGVSLLDPKTKTSRSLRLCIPPIQIGMEFMEAKKLEYVITYTHVARTSMAKLWWRGEANGWCGRWLCSHSSTRTRPVLCWRHIPSHMFPTWQLIIIITPTTIRGLWLLLYLAHGSWLRAVSLIHFGVCFTRLEWQGVRSHQVANSQARNLGTMGNGNTSRKQVCSRLGTADQAGQKNYSRFRLRFSLTWFLLLLVWRGVCKLTLGFGLVNDSILTLIPPYFFVHNRNH